MLVKVQRPWRTTQVDTPSGFTVLKSVHIAGSQRAFIVIACLSDQTALGVFYIMYLTQTSSGVVPLLHYPECFKSLFLHIVCRSIWLDCRGKGAGVLHNRVQTRQQTSFCHYSPLYGVNKYTEIIRLLTHFFIINSRPPWWVELSQYIVFRDKGCYIWKKFLWKKMCFYYCLYLLSFK